MKKNLTLKETILITSMLFGLFFGAGNLIFPVYMGQCAGKNVWLAIIGFAVTGVTLPLLAVAALGKSRSEGLYQLGLKVSKGYSLFFTCALYLTIGPFFAIPRCATTSFTVGIAALLNNDSKLALFLFTLLFFLAASFFVLRSSKILDWVGKILNPIFLIFLAILLVCCFVNPVGDYHEIAAVGSYETSALINGIYDGYNTLDALAGLAFGIIVVRVVRSLKIENEDDVARNTIFAGIFSCLAMGAIYVLLALAGAQNASILGDCSNGGEALAVLSNYYFGTGGTILLALIVTAACLKTAVGLISSCAEAFSQLFKTKISQKGWSIIFLAGSFAFANLGLDAIIEYSFPVLMFLYPLAVSLIILALSEKTLKIDQRGYRICIYTVLPFAVLELIRSLSLDNAFVQMAQAFANQLPLGNYNLEWLPAFVLALVISLLLKRKKN